MPERPLWPCLQPGCDKLVKKGYCSDHDKERHRERREANASTYTYRWQKYSERYLRRHPLCVICSRPDAPVIATDVDHIEPAKENEARFWDPENHQALCHSCHSKKTSKENPGWFSR
jgi:5-methylcytosine-specific restriction protein A